MASGTVTLSYVTTVNGDTSATVRVTMTYRGNGETWNSSPSSNNCYITLNGTTKYFTHAYTTSTSTQTMGYADFTITKTHNSQSLTATGGITNYSTYYSNPTGSCTVSVSEKTSYTITYNRNGRGTLIKPKDTKWYGETITLAAAPSNPGTGWTFVGWNTLSTETTAQYNASGSYTTNDATTLYAIWRKDITLSYDANGGNNAPVSQTNTIYNNETATSFIISSTQPTRSNYNFLGWLYDNTLYQPGSTISNVTANRELIASWELAYVPPQITTLNCVRLENDNSQATISIEWTKGNNGSDITSTQLSIAYKLSTSSTWTYITDTTGSTSQTETWINSNNTTYSTIAKNLSDNQYDIQIKVRNSSYPDKATFKNNFISAAFYVIDITANGQGIGLLITAPSEGIALGNHITTDLTLYTSSGNSPNLIFQRGTLDDNSNDWRIYNKNDYLYIGHRGSNSSDWPTNQEWYIDTAGKFTGSIDWTNINNKPTFAWTKIGEGSNTTSAISFAVEGHTVTTENYNEIMVVADTERNSAYHLFTVIIPQQRISTTAREVKLSGGEGSTTSTNCGAWGKITTTDFAPTGVWINNTTYTSSTTWYIYGR